MGGKVESKSIIKIKVFMLFHINTPYNTLESSREVLDGFHNVTHIIVVTDLFYNLRLDVKSNSIFGKPEGVAYSQNRLG